VYRGIHLSFPSFRRATTAIRISSGIKFLIANYVTFSSPRARESKSRMAREAYIQWPHRRTMPDHCGRRAVLLIVLSYVSISMATGICIGRFVEKIRAAPAAVIVRLRGRPTG